MVTVHVLFLSFHWTEIYKIAFAFELVNFLSSLLHHTPESRIINCPTLEHQYPILSGNFKPVSVYYSISS